MIISVKEEWDISKINEGPENRLNDYLGIRIKRGCIKSMIQPLSLKATTNYCCSVFHVALYQDPFPEGFLQ